MRAASAIRVGGDLSEVAADGAAPNGRIVVQPRALEKIARESAAGELGIPRDDVSVELSEGSHGVAVRVTAPLPVPDLDDTTAIQAGEPVLERVARLQEALRERIGRLAGRDVSRVDITVTGAVIAQRRRVK